MLVRFQASNVRSAANRTLGSFRSDMMLQAYRLSQAAPTLKYVLSITSLTGVGLGDWSGSISAWVFSNPFLVFSLRVIFHIKRRPSALKIQ